ncbi:hypothetical protein EN805_22220 [bacterium M00.F.Ca.ET.162.01.1.1]|nr:hypothetical protein EN848_28575 [bacterium M00.F.Ca.ET.205.01.1.1]TGU50447.1 hypothetical protein EN795_22825 [bacterium M00.F.Ca.ET.152.01.1.1]TGZ40811.1 hypothetical protein EN805_22220 [bacterium M00.F.Ca.ET.162.01.1.1]
MAWLSLANDEFLFLEIAEDYAVATVDAIKAVQIKTNTTPITLKSKEVIDTINSLFDISKRNHGKLVSLKHLTTSSIGLEKRKDDRIDGRPGLQYWIEARANAEIEPLRKHLLKLDLSEDAIQFLKSSSNQQIRDDLIRRIEWLGGAKDIDSLRQSLSNRLVYFGEQRSVASTLCDSMVDPLISRILNLASSKGSRRLERADFIRFFDEASRVSLSVSAVETMMSAIKPASEPHGFVSSVAILRPVASIDPNKFATRTDLVETIQQSMDRQNFAWLNGATGTGKSSLSRLIARRDGARWYSLQLRSFDPRETADALYRASAQIAIEKPRGVVLDDLGPLATSQPKDALLNLIETARRTSTSILVTSNVEPSGALLATLGSSAETAIKVGNLTEEEVKSFVLSEGGSKEDWGRYVYLATGGGQPLLVDAMVRGLQTAEWSNKELRELSAIVGNNAEIEQVKEGIRRRLFVELRDDESTLLLRLSFVLGTFDRKMAMFLGEVDPLIKIPGKAFDNLVGAWIEAESEDRFRLSSLISNAGNHTLGSKTTERLHHELAGYYTNDFKIDARRFDDIILHGMLGKNEQAVTIVSLAILSAKPEQLEIISRSNTSTISLRTDIPLYSENKTISVLIRMSQLLLIISSRNRKKFHNTLDAFERESDNLGDAATDELNVSTVYTKAMSLPSLVEVADDLPQFALTAADRARSLRAPLTEIDAGIEGAPTSLDGYIQFMFAFQLSQIQDIQTLLRVMKALVAKDMKQRQFLLKAFENSLFDKSLVIKSPWAKSIDGIGSNQERHAEDYLALGRELAGAGEAEFAMAAFESAAIIWDEYLKMPEKAIHCLKEATDLLGETQSAARALSRVLFHQGHYNRQLEIGMLLLESFDGGSTEASFFLRELAIGNSHIGAHEVAKALYLQAHNRIATDPLKGNTPMGAGLLADAAIEAHWGGDNAEAVRLLSQALDAADTLDPREGLHSAAVIRLISHTVVWLLMQITDDLAATDQHVMVAGANSNPSPHKGLEGPTALPLQYVWYLLANTEAAIDVDCGVIAKLLSMDWNTRAVLVSEISFYVSIASSAERRLSPQDYLSRMPRAIDARAFAEKNGTDLIGRGPSASPQKRLPQLKAEKFAEHRTRFTQNVLTFVLRLAFQNSPLVATQFVSDAFALRRPLITKAMLDAFLEGTPSPENGEVAIAGTIGCIVKALAGNQTLIVPDIMVACLRLVELLSNSFCEKSTINRVNSWLLSQWQAAMVDQAFRLSSPRLAQQSLLEFEQRAGEQVGDIADMILSLLPFVKVNINLAHKDWLVELKERKNDGQASGDG